ncbi:ribonuclease III domain-containing protein [Mycena rosella]|uniref:Ribonuclease III domain-containing protein n=1 Tax=Mycena rosella TaxID=1033263 RepID=A0AAD7CTG4_MYCRO|nr:ribonuclease III domain-containing protein [Mycena rosella]
MASRLASHRWRLPLPRAAAGKPHSAVHRPTHRNLKDFKLKLKLAGKQFPAVVVSGRSWEWDHAELDINGNFPERTALSPRKPIGVQLEPILEGKPTSNEYWLAQYLSLFPGSGIGHLLPSLPEIETRNIRLRVFTHAGNNCVKRDQAMQKLEFLGDSVLQLVLTRLVLEMYPEVQIGLLATIRELLVRNSTLAKISVKYKLPHQLKAPPSQPGLRLNTNAQGGLYADRGLECVQTWLETLFQPHIIEAYITLQPEKNVDPKGTGSPLPSSSAKNSAVDTCNYTELLYNHLQNSEKHVEWAYENEHPVGSPVLIWSASVLVDKQVLGYGKGRTKTAARDDAAKQGLSRMGFVF